MSFYLTIFVSTHHDRAASKNSFLASVWALSHYSPLLKLLFSRWKKKRQVLPVPFVPQLSANKIIVQYINLNIAGLTDTVNIIIQTISVFGMELSIDFRNCRT